MTLHSIREGWLIAVDQLRANKLRSGLTILGVVIGIATVMAMASIVAGFREQIVNTLEVVGPTTFRILRFFSSTPLNPDALPREVRIRPALAPEEAEAIARIGGRPFRVLGVWQRPTNIFEVPGAPEIAGIVPFEAARERFQIDQVNGLIILVKPRPDVSVARAMDAATLQLRRLRGLRVGEANSFDLLTSDQVLGIFDSLTFAFFFVMLVLSSIALLVGWIRWKR